MRYRVYIEPMDIECSERKDLELFARVHISKGTYTISRILPIDKDGFPIKQN